MFSFQLKLFQRSALKEAFPGEIAAKKGVVIAGAQNTERTEPLFELPIVTTSAKCDISIQWGLYHDGTVWNTYCKCS